MNTRRKGWAAAGLMCVGWLLALSYAAYLWVISPEGVRAVVSQDPVSALVDAWVAVISDPVVLVAFCLVIPGMFLWTQANRERDGFGNFETAHVRDDSERDGDE